jgi:hypothetical protein
MQVSRRQFLAGAATAASARKVTRLHKLTQVSWRGHSCLPRRDSDLPSSLGISESMRKQHELLGQDGILRAGWQPALFGACCKLRGGGLTTRRRMPTRPTSSAQFLDLRRSESRLDALRSPEPVQRQASRRVSTRQAGGPRHTGGYRVLAPQYPFRSRPAPFE